MNERIKELYTQICIKQNLPFTLEHNSAYMLDAFADKFSELIVRECISELRDAFDMTIEEGNHLKEHFGVE